MSNPGKTAIICIGGGMRSAHGAGFLYALATKLGITEPDIIIGTSGNAGNVLYYTSRQYESAVHVWCDGMLSTSKFISLLRPWKILNVDYLVDTVFKQHEPLNIEALLGSAIDWYVPATDTETGKARYFGKTDHPDVYELLRVAKAIPIFYRKRIVIFGKTYFDGEMGPTVADHLHHAISRGAKKILIVNDNTPKNRLSSLEMHIYAAMQSPHLRDALVRDIDEEKACITAKNATVLCVSTKDLPIGVLTRNKKKLIQAFDTGMQNALAMEQELRTLFQTPV